MTSTVNQVTEEGLVITLWHKVKITHLRIFNSPKSKPVLGQNLRPPVASIRLALPEGKNFCHSFVIHPLSIIPINFESMSHYGLVFWCPPSFSLITYYAFGFDSWSLILWMSSVVHGFVGNEFGSRASCLLLCWENSFFNVYAMLHGDGSSLF